MSDAALTAPTAATSTPVVPIGPVASAATPSTQGVPPTSAATASDAQATTPSAVPSQAASSVNLSPQALHSIRLETFSQLVANLVHQIQQLQSTPTATTVLPSYPSTPVSAIAALQQQALLLAQPMPPTQSQPLLNNAIQVAPIVVAAQTALAHSINISFQTQQNIKLETFTQLVAKLVNQIQGTPIHVPTSWPASGVTPQWHALLSTLVQQATVGQPLPQQLVSAQPWPTTLVQAVLQQAAQPAQFLSAPVHPHTVTSTPTHTTQHTASPTSAAGPHIPELQNWLVLQGSIRAQDGERSFTMTVQVPAAWAQAQAALGAALPHSVNTIPGTHPILQLSFSGSVQQLSSGTLGLVMQPQAIAGTPAAIAAQMQALRTSAVLHLELQPLPPSATQVAQTQTASTQMSVQMSAFMPAHLQQELQIAQGRNQDPWLIMAQQQASGQQPRQSTYAGEQSGLCVIAGCQYEGRAVCAQPFCAQMNYLWSVARAQRRA